MKLKLNVLLAILVGVVLVMGCSWRGRLNFYDPNDIGYDDVEDEDYTKYGVTLVFCNLEYAFEDEYPTKLMGIDGSYYSNMPEDNFYKVVKDI